MSGIGDVIGNVVGSLTGSTGIDAARGASAANIQQIELGIGELETQFGQTEQAFDPFIQGGQQAFQQQAALSGAQGPEAQRLAFQNFQQSPGQQFLQQRGERALLRNAAVTGDLGGARTRQALQEQGIGFASQDFGNQFARLGQVSQQGGGFASQLGQLRGGLGTNIANLRGNIGQAQAQGIQGEAAARDASAQNVIGLASAAAGFFSDVQLKENIQKVGDIKGVNFYSWDWNDKANDLGMSGKDFGVIAQEIERSHPQFVIDGAFLKVDKQGLYDSLGSE